jgi:hypothetical protein
VVTNGYTLRNKDQGDLTEPPPSKGACPVPCGLRDDLHTIVSLVEVPMPFILRPSRRFSVVCTVAYAHWFREGEGMVWNCSPMGWRLSGNLPLERGDVW